VAQPTANSSPATRLGFRHLARLDDLRLALDGEVHRIGNEAPFVRGFASAQAIRALSRWLKGQRYRRIDIRRAIIAAFDRLYTTPLLHVRAFLRSAVLSSCVYLAYNIVLFRIRTDLVHIIGFIAGLLWAILSDYASLFLIRRYLLIAKSHPFVSLILAGTVGTIFVMTTYLLITAFTAIGVIWTIFPQIDVQLTYAISQFLLLHVFPTAWFHFKQFFLSVAVGLIVHLWLPLFAVGALGVQLLYPIFRAVEWAQWFLKQGNRHPLRAIGAVAAAVVFVVTTIWKVLAVIL
jgi:hypothetical protein